MDQLSIRNDGSIATHVSNALTKCGKERPPDTWTEGLKMLTFFMDYIDIGFSPVVTTEDNDYVAAVSYSELKFELHIWEARKVAAVSSAQVKTADKDKLERLEKTGEGRKAVRQRMSDVMGSPYVLDVNCLVEKEGVSSEAVFIELDENCGYKPIYLVCSALPVISELALRFRRKRISCEEVHKLGGVGLSLSIDS